MKTEKKATYEEMMAEATVRMKMLGLPQAQLDTFEKYGILNYSSEDPVPLLEELEEKLGYGFWAIHEEEDSDMGGFWETYYLFFVTDNPDNWERERAELLSMEPTVYRVIEWRYNIDFDGTYDQDRQVEDYMKVHIRVTENGNIVVVNEIYNR